LKIKDNKTVRYVISHFICGLSKAVPLCVRGSFKMFLQSLSEKHKKYNNLTYISFKIVPFYKYILLPTTVKVLETFTKAILWDIFQLVRHILNDVISIKKHHPINTNLHRGNRQKAAAIRSVDCGECSSVVTLFLLRNPCQKPTGVLEQCSDEGTNTSFSIILDLSFWPHP
jgi:hypothetical protein